MDESLDELTQMAARQTLKNILTASYEQELARKKIEWAIVGIDENSPEAVKQAYLLHRDHQNTLAKLDAPPPQQISFATPKEPPKPLPPAGEEDISDISDPGILWQIAKRKDYTK